MTLSHCSVELKITLEKLEGAVLAGQMRIVEMQKTLFREFVIKPLVNELIDECCRTRPDSLQP